MKNKLSTIFSIGHGNKSLEVFLQELLAYNIEYLIDVRTTPYSKWNSHFNQNELKFYLKEHNIGYIFLGDKIGGLPTDKSCYTKDGKIDYLLLKDKDFFQEGISRLISANDKSIRVATMCSETKPEECHRSKLIGKELLIKNIDMQHILNKNELKSQSAINNELFGLFSNCEDFHLSSKKSYGENK
jgi:uncharacterized protein (DUF488 family)